MVRKNKKKSRILETVHEATKDLYSLGLIDKKKMDKYNLLCTDSVPDYSPSKIKSLRTRHNISQAVLATVINTSLSTVRQWEIGEKHPSGPSLKLLNILDTKGLEVFINQQPPNTNVG
jgi:putative transcriptional regulator